MPKVQDPRVIQGKKCRDEAIRKKFKAYMDENKTVEFALDQLIIAYGLSESTITKILKKTGIYAKQ